MAYINDFEFGGYFKNTLYSFYKDISEDVFIDISKEELEDIKARATLIKNNHYNNKNFGEIKVYKYCKLMERLLTNFKRRNGNDIPYDFDSNTHGEKYLLFMLTVDPECKALEIYLTENSKKIIKEKIRKELGVYDPFLVRVENYYIKKLASKSEKHKYKTKINNKMYI